MTLCNDYDRMYNLLRCATSARLTRGSQPIDSEALRIVNENEKAVSSAASTLTPHIKNTTNTSDETGNYSFENLLTAHSEQLHAHRPPPCGPRHGPIHSDNCNSMA